MRIIDRFSSEHEVFLSQLETIESLCDSDATAAELAVAVRTLSTPLLRHAENEETALFPDLAPSLGAEGGPLGVLIEEHHLLHGQLERMGARPARNELVSVLDAFARLLREHIAKEEDVLFPAAAQIIGDERLAEMDGVMGKLGV